MNADEFRDYALGFIFYKYLSEKVHIYGNNILDEDAIEYLSLDESTSEGQEMNCTTYNLARMNMILHGVHYRNFGLKNFVATLPPVATLRHQREWEMCI